MAIKNLSDEDLFQLNGFSTSIRSNAALKEEGVESDSFSIEMSNKDYHADHEHVSCSQLKQLLRSPGHYQAYLNKPPEKSTAGQNIGTAVHTAILEPHLFQSTVIEWSGGRKQGKHWNDFYKTHTDKTILSTEEMQQVVNMRDAVRSYRLPMDPGVRLSQIIDKGESEESIFFRDKETGILCKIRPDSILRPRATLDLKTCGDSRPDEFLKTQAMKNHYDLQAAMYWSGVKACLGFNMPFCFIAVETELPHGVWLHETGPGSEFFENGMAKFRYALRTLKKCRENDEWPVYSSAYTTLDNIPPYSRFAAPDGEE